MSSVVFLPIASHQRLLLPLAAPVRAASVTTQRARIFRAAIVKCDVTHGGRPVATVTLSAGAATYPRDSGRNRFEHAATE